MTKKQTHDALGFMWPDNWEQHNFSIASATYFGASMMLEGENKYLAQWLWDTCYHLSICDEVTT